MRQREVWSTGFKSAILREESAERTRGPQGKQQTGTDETHDAEHPAKSSGQRLANPLAQIDRMKIHKSSEPSCAPSAATLAEKQRQLRIGIARHATENHRSQSGTQAGKCHGDEDELAGNRRTRHSHPGRRLQRAATRPKNACERLNTKARMRANIPFCSRRFRQLASGISRTAKRFSGQLRGILQRRRTSGGMYFSSCFASTSSATKAPSNSSCHASAWPRQTDPATRRCIRPELGERSP